MNDYVELHLPRVAYQRDYLHRFPNTPEAVQGGLLRDAHQRAERARERAGLASGAVNRLARRVDELEALVRGACWDMTLAELAEVAGARAGIELCAKERPMLSQAAMQAQGDAGPVESELQSIWAEYQRLLRQVREQAERGMPPAPKQRERIEALIGCWPEVREPAVEAVLAGVGREG